MNTDLCQFNQNQEHVATLKELLEIRNPIGRFARALRAAIEMLSANCTIGVGGGGGRLFVHGDYESIKQVQRIIFRAEKVRDWNPIATAPKDGTYVLLCEWSGHVHIAQWCDGNYWRARVDEPNPDWHPVGWQRLPPPMEMVQ